MHAWAGQIHDHTRYIQWVIVCLLWGTLWWKGRMSIHTVRVVQCTRILLTGYSQNAVVCGVAWRPARTLLQLQLSSIESLVAMRAYTLILSSASLLLVGTKRTFLFQSVRDTFLRQQMRTVELDIFAPNETARRPT